MDLRVVCIVSLTILEGIALFKGINGSQFMAVVAIVGGLGGYVIAKEEKNKKKTRLEPVG
jgi:hypothetical protein